MQDRQVGEFLDAFPEDTGRGFGVTLDGETTAPSAIFLAHNTTGGSVLECCADEAVRRRRAFVRQGCGVRQKHFPDTVRIAIEREAEGLDDGGLAGTTSADDAREALRKRH